MWPFLLASTRVDDPYSLTAFLVLVAVMLLKPPSA